MRWGKREGKLVREKESVGGRRDVMEDGKKNEEEEEKENTKHRMKTLWNSIK